MSQPIRGQGGHFVFSICQKNTNLVEDVEILLPVKFHWIPFSGFKGEVENVSANKRQGRPSWFSDRHENTNLVEDVEFLLPVMFPWILFGSFRGEVTKAHISCTWVTMCHLFDRSAWAAILFSGYREVENVSANQRLEKSKMSQPIRGWGGHLVFPISPKNTNLVEDVEILLPVMFRWILFSGFRGEVQNVSANRSLGWPSCFSDRPEKHNKLGRGHWNLTYCQVSLNSVQQFQRRSRKCLSQSEAGAAILFFR